jgi:signal transduction histidine kinase
MRLSSKILFLTAALLGFLVCHAFISWQEMNKINIEFNKIVNNDLTLMESANALNDVQLKKEILFEKLTSSAEELAFTAITESRKQYLLDYVKDIQSQFHKDSLSAKSNLETAMSLPEPSSSLSALLSSLHKNIVSYDRKVEAIFTDVLGQGYQLSMEDLDHIETEQDGLSKGLQKVLEQISLRVDGSIEKIRTVQKRSQQVIWISLILSFLFAVILASAIIRRIHSSLHGLVQGVSALQKGQLGSHVQVTTSDEIGELGKAFNKMSDQLKEFQETMQRKNVELNSSLVITREQKRELEKINRDLDRFVHLISHDINGPITAIVSYADYLQKHKEITDPKTQQIISNLKHVTGRLNAMVLDLVEMTKITRTQRPFEHVDVEALLKEVLERQQFNIQKTGAEIRLPSTFPVIFADRLKLTIVFFNLVGNAIKYASKDGHQPKVSLSWEKRSKDYVFCVKDNGIGIAPEYFETIFDMFKRLPEAEGFEGSGVGLAIVKEIITEHGGQIWVTSAPGAGSQFFFTIPLESSSALG